MTDLKQLVERARQPVPEDFVRVPTLRWLQANLPWTIPYSDEFERSAKRNARRRIGHDVLHVMKSLGRIAAEVERCDHASDKAPLFGEAFAKELADLVICALHMASIEGIDIEDAVIDNSSARNGVSLRAMLAAAPKENEHE
jgi:nitrite reductase/ring-hydroxylating ferredoxin subunit